MLTKAQRKRLAHEARKLASEIIDGRAPHLNPDSYCGCAIGTLVKRGLPSRWSNVSTHNDPFYLLAVAIDMHLPAPWMEGLGIVSRDLQEHGPEALPFPLLALADELEAAS